MRRVLGVLVLGWLLAVAPGLPAAAAAVDGGLDGVDPCSGTINGDPVVCDDGGGDGFGGGFAAIVVVFVLIGAGVTIFKVSMARDMARKSGMDPDQATAMTLLSDDGLDATYLASNLRPQVDASAAPAAPAATAATGRSVSERLAELEALREQGLVTQVEYDARRTAILDSL